MSASFAGACLTHKPMEFNARQIAEPKYWEEFEDLCLDLFREIWGDPTAQKNGRRGQAQHGTDIWGTPRSPGDKLHGVQCKVKDAVLGAEVTEAELRSEVHKAKNFTPKLAHWILATTAPKDAKIESVAREITAEHQRKLIPLFPVARLVVAQRANMG
jgi:hypothetical protein